MYRADTVVQLPKLTPIDIAANQLSQSPKDSLIDLTEDRLLQSLDSSRTDSEDSSLGAPRYPKSQWKWNLFN